MRDNNYLTKNNGISQFDGVHYSRIKSGGNEIPGSLKVAIVHDWFVNYAGSERCVESFTNIFPDADIFSIVDYLNHEDREIILKGKKSKTSFIQNLPLSKTKFRYYLPLFPQAVEQFNLNNYDLVISSSHAVAKGVLTNTYQTHICYCHTPMRYAWNNYHQYINVSGLQKGIKGLLTASTLQYLRNWDFQSSTRPDYFIANSKHISKQIKKRYNREASVIYPPVDTDKFEVNNNKEEFYLTVSRMVPNKRVDIVVNAFSKMKDKKLVVIGDGPLKKRLKKFATNNIEFIDPLPFEDLKIYMQKAKGFISAAEEDFGITVVEAMAAGTPVIAFSRGGTGESVIDNKTGILFHESSVESLIYGIEKFESNIKSFDAYMIKEYSNKFNRNYFELMIKEFIVEKIMENNN